VFPAAGGLHPRKESLDRSLFEANNRVVHVFLSFLKEAIWEMSAQEDEEEFSMMMSKQRGFALIELLIVAAILPNGRRRKTVNKPQLEFSTSQTRCYSSLKHATTAGNDSSVNSS
jgi:prepilin-type N-terminal cleavage/methylation domain-containing protein